MRTSGYRLRTVATLTVVTLTTVANILHLCFLGYWVRSEVNEDIPQTPGFSVHMFTNSVLAAFSVISIVLNLKMAYMVKRGELFKAKYSCISQTNTFVVTSYVMFAAISTFLFVNFPLYRLAPSFPRAVNVNGTGNNSELNIPTWLDRFQARYHCCGRDSYLDYKYMVSNIEGLKRVPKSCCKKIRVNRSENKSSCEVDVFSMIPALAHLVVNTEGCRKRLERYFEILTLVTMCFCWTIFGLSFISMLAFRCEFKLARAKDLDEDNMSQIMPASGENSIPSVPHHELWREESQGKSQMTVERKPEYPNGYNPALPQLFGSGTHRVRGAQEAHNTARKSRRPPPVQQRRSQSHPYDYFSRHGLSNVP